MYCCALYCLPELPGPPPLRICLLPASCASGPTNRASEVVSPSIASHFRGSKRGIGGRCASSAVPTRSARPLTPRCATGLRHGFARSTWLHIPGLSPAAGSQILWVSGNTVAWPPWSAQSGAARARQHSTALWHSLRYSSGSGASPAPPLPAGALLPSGSRPGSFAASP